MENVNIIEMDRPIIREEWAKFLKQQIWDYFITITKEFKIINVPIRLYQSVVFEDQEPIRVRGRGEKQTRYYKESSYPVVSDFWKREYQALRNVWSSLIKMNASKGFMGAEPFKQGHIHVHALVGGRRGVEDRQLIKQPHEIWKSLFKKFGRSKVERIISVEDVSKYCSKYIMKEQHFSQDTYSVVGNWGS